MHPSDPDYVESVVDYRMVCDDCGEESGWLVGCESEAPEGLPETCSECGSSNLVEVTREHDSYDEFDPPDEDGE